MALPTKKTKIVSQDPRNLIIFSNPKAGKSSSISQLPDTLILDLEDGYKYLNNCYVQQIETVQDLYNVAKDLRTEKHNFKFVAIDTVTKLEEVALSLAKKLYMDTPMGKNFDGDNVLKLPQGAGHLYLREAMQKIISWFEIPGINLILVGHVKDKSLTEGGTELTVKNLDLAGKISTILSAKSDAIAYLYRDTETGDLMANFGDMNSVLTGARMPHLAGKTIQLAERIMNDKGEWEIITHWDRIFPSLKESNE
jgi:hypothetical protein